MAELEVEQQGPLTCLIYTTFQLVHEHLICEYCLPHTSRLMVEISIGSPMASPAETTIDRWMDECING